jgi:drug/metabolite transporter (DMT)-like permease
MGEGSGRTSEAALLVTGGMALFGLIDNFMRLAAETGGLWQFYLLRSLVAVAVLVPLAAWLGARLSPIRPGRVAIRSALQAVAMAIYFGCLAFMPIAQVVAGLFTAPLFVVLFAALFFGERPGPRRLLAVLLGFAGILLALGVDPATMSAWTALPVLAGAAYGAGNLVTRQWCAEEGTAALLLAFFLMTAAFGALGSLALWLWPQPVPEGAAGFATRGWVWPAGWFLAMILMQGVGSLLGVGLAIRAYQIASATVVAVFENALLVFATLWAILLWREVPSPVEGFGLALVVAAGVLIALRAPRAVARREEAP